MKIAFANLKGGVGKSKLNVYFANYLTQKGLRVAVVDCDVSQYSTRAYERSENEFPHILEYKAEETSDILKFVDQCDAAYDFVLVDLPGTFQQDGMIELTSQLDHVIIPTNFSSEVIQSTDIYRQKMKELGVPYSILMNSYEIQFNHEQRLEEENGFIEMNDFFEGNVLSKGIRVERGLFENKFVVGELVLNHKSSKRVHETLELIYSLITK